jgi:hypothetical protein
VLHVAAAAVEALLRTLTTAGEEANVLERMAVAASVHSRLEVLGVRVRFGELLQSLTQGSADAEQRRALAIALSQSCRQRDVTWDQRASLLLDLREQWLPQLSHNVVLGAVVQHALVTGTEEGRRFAVRALPFAAKAAGVSLADGTTSTLERLKRTLLDTGRPASAAEPLSPSRALPQRGPASVPNSAMLLDDEPAAEAVVAAALELVSAASDLSDPQLSQAENLLLLLPGNHPKAMAARGVIQALRLLDHSGVQVRTPRHRQAMP